MRALMRKVPAERARAEPARHDVVHVAQFRVSVLLVRAHLEFAAAHGVSLDDVLAASGFSRTDAEDDEREAPVELVNTLWTAMTTRTGDLAYGLHLAEQQTPFLGTVDYCFRHAATVREALRRLFAYQRLLHGPIQTLSLVEEQGLTRLCFRPPLPAEVLPAQVPQFVLARIVTMLRRDTGRAVALRKVSFRHPAPAVHSEHRRVFGCPLEFGAPVDALDLDPALLELPFPPADRGLDIILSRYASEMLARRPQENDPVSCVRRAIADALQGGPPDVDTLAKRLGMSARTLRRRLEEQGTSYQQMLDDVRAELARSYLGNRAIKIVEIAYLLGFADVGAFYRAFRRWTATTPREYRLASGGAASP